MESKRDSDQKEMLAVSLTTTVSMERKHNRPLRPQGGRHKMTEEDPSKGSAP